jgi:colicin import membrane protein
VEKKPPGVKERLLVKTVTLQPRTSSSRHPKDAIAYMPAPAPTPPQPDPFTPPPQPATPPETPQPAPFNPPPQPATPPEPPQPAPPPQPPQPAAPTLTPQPTPFTPIEKKKPQKPVNPQAQQKPKAMTPSAPKKTTDAQPKKTPTASAPTQVKKAKSTPVTEKKEEAKPTIDPVVEAKKARQRELLAKAKESMSKAGQARSHVSSSSSSSPIAQADVPKAIGSLQIDTFSLGEPVSLTTKETSYRDEIAHRLKLGLRLPDYGEVKIKLTLERSGKVSHVQIVSSKNAKNKQYVEKTIPTLTFPSFGDNFDDSQYYTFVICLNNEY